MNDDSHKGLLFDDILNYRKNASAVKDKDRYQVICGRKFRHKKLQDESLK